MEREEIRNGVVRALRNIKGIGPVKAEQGATSVMGFLDSLVREQEGEELGVDDDGIMFMKRPDGVPENHNYLFWSTTRQQVWSISSKPRKPEGTADHWHGSASKERSYEMHSMVVPIETHPIDRIRRLI